MRYQMNQAVRQVRNEVEHCAGRCQLALQAGWRICGDFLFIMMKRGIVKSSRNSGKYGL